MSVALVRAPPTTMMLDFAAVRLNPDRAKDKHLVLKEKEISKFGEYRTRRLLLEAWGRQFSR